jgi:hypothetical protein
MREDHHTQCPGLAARVYHLADLVLQAVSSGRSTSRNACYRSCPFSVWADDAARAGEAKQRILAKAGSTRITEPTFSIDWHFVSSGESLEAVSIEGIAACDADKRTRASLAFAADAGKKRTLAELYQLLQALG